MLEHDHIFASLGASRSARADRARLRGARRKDPVTTEFEVRILRQADRKVLHAGAVSPLVSSSFLEALFMTTNDSTLQRIVPRNPRAPLWVIGHGVCSDFDASALDAFARRMGRPDLAPQLCEPVADRRATLLERWAELGGGAPPQDEPRWRSGEERLELIVQREAIDADRSASGALMPESGLGAH